MFASARVRLRVVDLMGFHNPKRKRGIEQSRFTSVSINPSLTRRVMIKPTTRLRRSATSGSYFETVP